VIRSKSATSGADTLNDNTTKHNTKHTHGTLNPSCLKNENVMQMIVVYPKGKHYSESALGSSNLE
jgi:hypothetical protein